MMIAGIAFQVATMGLAGVLVLAFAVRYKKGNTGHRSGSDISMKPKFAASREDKEHTRTVFLYCAVVALAYLTVLIRCIYRLVITLPEIQDADFSPTVFQRWPAGGEMQNETEFLILDGA
jgi:hypothetical protein